MIRLKIKLEVSPSRLKAMKAHWNKTKQEYPEQLSDLRKRIPFWVLEEFE